MNLIVIAGFLGSGKTTLLMQIAKAFSEQTDKKLAIVENEVGKVGIDDHLLREEGLPVKEIYSGCICCSLRMDLIQTLLQLEREYNPDVVILEPSGVASPRQVLNALNGYGGEINTKKVLTVVDASRFQKIQDLSIPLIADGIAAADTIVLNKTDLVHAEQFAAIDTRIRNIRSDVRILPVSATQPETVTGLIDEILTADESARESTQMVSLSEADADGPRPVVHAHDIRLAFTAPMPAEHVTGVMADLMTELAASLKAAGCALIGHLKAVVRAGNGGYYMFSATSFDQPIQTKGRLARLLPSEATVTVNAIVYEVEKPVLETLVADHVERHLGEWF